MQPQEAQQQESVFQQAGRSRVRRKPGKGFHCEKRALRDLWRAWRDAVGCEVYVDEIEQ